MNEDDMLGEDDLREKLHHDQEQKRKIQVNQQGGVMKLGTQMGFQELDRSRFDSHALGGKGRRNFFRERGGKMIRLEIIWVERGCHIGRNLKEGTSGVVMEEEAATSEMIAVDLRLVGILR